MSKREATVRWYAACAAYFEMPAGMRQPVSRQALASYRRIAKMPPVWGEALDGRGAPLFVVRWVAWANDVDEGERRLREAITSWDGRRRWPRWDRLTCGEGRGRGRAGKGEEREGSAQTGGAGKGEERT